MTMSHEILELTINELGAVSGGDSVGGPVRAPNLEDIRPGPVRPPNPANPGGPMQSADFDPVIVRF
jgi:hypothetical protein